MPLKNLVNDSSWGSDDLVTGSSPQLKPEGQGLLALGPQHSHSTGFAKPGFCLEAVHRFPAASSSPSGAPAKKLCLNTHFLPKSVCIPLWRPPLSLGGRLCWRWGGLRLPFPSLGIYEMGFGRRLQGRNGCEVLSMECNPQPIVSQLIMVNQPEHSSGRDPEP